MRTLLSIATICLLLVSCGGPSYTDVPVGQFTQMKPFKATVEKIYVEDFRSTGQGMVAIVGFKTQDGRRLSIGGTQASDEMVGFAHSIQQGQSYLFPDTFLDYRKTRGAQ